MSQYIRQSPIHISVVNTAQELLPALPAGQAYQIHAINITRRTLTDTLQLLEGSTVRIEMTATMRIQINLDFGPMGWLFLDNSALNIAGPINTGIDVNILTYGIIV